MRNHLIALIAALMLIASSPLALAQSPQERLERARRLEQGGVMMEAMTIYQELVLENSENVEARISLAQLLLKMGQMEDALPHVDWLAQRASSDSRVPPMVEQVRDYRREKYGRDLNQYEVRLEESNNDPDVLLEYARWLASRNRQNEAYRRYTEYLAKRPSDTNVRFELAQQYAWRGQYGNARAQVAQLLRVQPNSTRAYLLLGDMEYWQGNTDEALEQYRKVLEISPDNTVAQNKISEIENQPGYREGKLKEELAENPTSPALVELAQIYMEQDRIWEADSLVGVRLEAEPTDEQALQLATAIEVRKRDMRMQQIEEYRLMRMENPSDTTAILGLARYYTGVPDFDAALEMYDEYLELYPEDYDIRLERAKVLSWAGYSEEAATEFEQISVTLPDSREARLGHAEALVASGIDLDTAQRIFENDLEENPDSTRALVGLADTYRLQGYYNEARPLYNSVLESDPENRRAQAGLDAMGTEMSPVIARLQREHQEDPENNDTLRQLAILLFEAKRYFEAETYVTMYLDRFPSDQRFLTMQDEIRVLKDEQMSAERLKLKTYLTEHPEDTAARIRYAELLAAEDDTDDAIAQYRLVLQRRPNDDDLKFQVANLLANEERYEEAIPLMQELVDENLNNFEYRYKLGQMYAWSGNYDRAIEEYERAMEIEPDNEDIRISMGNAYRWDGELYKAHDEYRRVLALNPNNEVAEQQLNSLNHIAFLGLDGTASSSWDSEDFALREAYTTAILAVSLKMKLRGGIGGVSLSQTQSTNRNHEFIERGQFYVGQLDYSFDRQTSALIQGRYYVFENQTPWYINIELNHEFSDEDDFRGMRGTAYYRTQAAVFEIASVSGLGTYYSEYTTDRFGLRGTWKITGRWLAEADGSFTTISDGNSRTDVMGEVRYALRHFLQVGANYQYITSEIQAPEYWTPDGYATVAGVVLLQNSFSKWNYRIRGSLGRVMETGDATRSINATLGFRLGQHFNATLGGFALRTVRTDGSYTYSALLGSLIWSL